MQMPLDDLILVWRFAVALGCLSDAALASRLDRLGIYSGAGVLTLCRSMTHLAAIDAAALRAERARRALQVGIQAGAGFQMSREAA